MAAAETARLIASLELKDNLSKGIGKAMGGLDKLEGKFNKLGGIAQRGIGNAAHNIASIGVIAGVAAAGIITKSIAAASDLNETISKTNIVFGKSAQAVLDFGKSSAAGLGLSQNAALSAAATYGNLFVSMGLTAKQAAGMSTKLVTLAGDLASFNNLDPTEVTEKLRAGLTGESEPLKSLGININETIIKAKALELGLVKTGQSTAELKLKTIAMNTAQKEAAAATKKYGASSTEALKATVKAEKAQAALEKTTKTFPGTIDAATKAQAAYALIFEQSTTAQGDFARTSDGLANQQRILKANFENTAAVLGTALLPKVSEVVKKINEMVVTRQPDIERLAGKLPAVFDKVMNLVVALPWGAIESAFTVMGMGADALLTAFTSIPPWVQTAVLTGWGLNKLTGGALGDIVGELGKGLIKGVLGMNAGVVNINAATVNGGVGGAAAGAAAGGLSGVSKMFLVGEAIGLGLIVNAVREDLGTQNSQKATEIAATQIDWLKQQPTKADLQSGLAAVEKGINDIQANPLNVLVQGEALEKLKQMRSDIQAQLANPLINRPALIGGVSLEDRDAKGAADRADTLKRALDAGFKGTAAAVEATLARTALRQEAAARTVAAAAAAAISAGKDRDSSPVTNVAVTVNVTAAAVAKSVVIQNRFGPSGGSRDRGSANTWGGGT